jgi:hypothetical protein
MTNNQHLGIDPVDYVVFDNSDIQWDKHNEQWVVAGKTNAFCHLHTPSTNPSPIIKHLLWDAPDDISGSDTTKKYDNHDVNMHYLDEFFAYLYVLGYSEDQFSSLTIDEIVKKIRDTYKYKHGEPSDLASQVYIKRMNIAMLRGVRRSNYGVQVTKDGR